MSQSSVYCVQVVVRVKPNYSHLSIDHKQHGEGNATLAYGRHAFLDRTPVYLDLRACHPQGVRGAQHRGTAGCFVVYRVRGGALVVRRRCGAGARAKPLKFKRGKRKGKPPNRTIV